MTFNQWLETFVEEKGIDKDRTFEVTVDGTWNLIPVGAVIEFIQNVDPQTQAQIKTNFVKIDFHNGDVYHFIRYMAEGMARAYA